MNKIQINLSKESPKWRNYSKGDDFHRMQDAVHEHFTNPEKPLSKIAEEWGVSRKSLTEIIEGRLQLDVCAGKKPYLSPEEENLLVSFLIEIADLGFGYSLNAIRNLLKSLFAKDPTEFSKGWHQSFMGRHPELTI